MKSIKTDVGFDSQKSLIEIGPTINVKIGDPRFYNPVDVPGLIDTGATFNAIDNNLAKSLNLQSRDKLVDVSGSAGKHKHNAYPARIQIPDLKVDSLYLFAGLKLEEGEQVHKVILGRIFLADCQLDYFGLTGKVTITRFPSS